MKEYSKVENIMKSIIDLSGDFPFCFFK